MFLELSLQQWILAILAAVCLGMSKTGFMGVNLIGIALMASVYPARESTGVILPMLIFGDLVAVPTYRRHADWREVIRVLPPTLAGVVLGFWVFRMVPAHAFASLIGWIVVVLLLVSLWQRRQRLRMNRPSRSAPMYVGESSGFCAVGVPPMRDSRPTVIAWIVGIIGGVTTMLANAAGPIMTIYFLGIGLPKLQFLGTVSWLFLVVNLWKLPFSVDLGVVTPNTLLVNLSLIPAIGLGGYLGRELVKIVSQQWFERILLALAVLAAIKLILA